MNEGVDDIADSYAGITRIRFIGFPRSADLSHGSSTPLPAYIIHDNRIRKGHFHHPEAGWLSLPGGHYG
jgi:hypothetical protein